MVRRVRRHGANEHFGMSVAGVGESPHVEGERIVRLVAIVEIAVERFPQADRHGLPDVLGGVGSDAVGAEAAIQAPARGIGHGHAGDEMEAD